MTESLDAARPEVAEEEAEFRSVDAQISMTLDAAVRPRPVRVAISGRRVSPPLFESMEILGQYCSLERLRRLRATLAS